MPAGVNRTQDPRRFTFDVLKAVRSAPGNEDERALGGVGHLLPQSEAKCALEQVPNLILSPVEVQRRAFPR